MEFKETLFNWYNTHKRDLPWRKTKNPYYIWLSEIILQQTRVDQGLPYYKKFVEEFPKIKDLAEADEEKVLKLWQGLGYYSRARNLHFTAKSILTKFNGTFPQEYEQVISLKGIGEYTAAAIVSFAYNKPYAVVDGNVYRVLSRYFGVDLPIDSSAGKKYFQDLANSLLDKNHAGEFNQSIMEFGALQCVPKNPTCNNCPFIDSCMAFSQNKIDSLPFKSQKTKQRDRFFNYLVITKKEELLINKRKENDIWQNLYDFPMIETSERTEENELVASEKWLYYFKNQTVRIKNISKEYKHILSHQKIFARFWQIELDSFPSVLKENYIQISNQNLHEYAVSKLIDNYLKQRET